MIGIWICESASRNHLFVAISGVNVFPSVSTDSAAPGIPVVDLFAGPGGLGEGFASLRLGNRRAFRVALSVEKDAGAHETLLLRNFFREFADGQVPDDYYGLAHVSPEARADLYGRHRPESMTAEATAKQAELGAISPSVVDRWISRALHGRRAWVLVGGPPCQAYSLVGRSRNRGKKDYCPEEDTRHFLYLEYLRIIQRHWPPVFVFENVKGLLSAKIDGKPILGQILADLARPAVAAQGRERYTYRLHSLVTPISADDVDGASPSDFVVRSEDYGVPQSRHRILLLGVREDIQIRPRVLQKRTRVVPVDTALKSSPPLRSRLSRQPDGAEQWLAAIRGNEHLHWMQEPSRVAELGRLVLRDLVLPSADVGSSAVRNRGGRTTYNHISRAHMRTDLSRYFFASCYASVHGESPLLRDFPPELLPDHRNVGRAIADGHFADRFNVQVWGKPATTITSHLAKDGHYYIHPDPAQCRSLTVREAARVQTFPDDYVFCGERTSQYVQVGNAVPPLLAEQIAAVVLELLEKSELVEND